MSDEGKEKTGFARMTPERRKEIASKGGRAAHQSGNAHRFNSESAREAGLLSSPNRHRWTTEAAREAGRKGGRAAAKARAGVVAADAAGGEEP